MNEAKLYQRSNCLQKRDAIKILNEYSNKIKWLSYGDRIIDIGCGDGSVTVDILKHFLPEYVSKVIGCDISAEMVKHANHYHGNEEISFVVQDIEGSLNEDLIGEFNHVFSFYAMHWIMNQEKAFSNIYDLLDVNGDCLLVFLGHMPLYDVYRLMAEKPKWKRLMKDVDRFISPYHDSQEPEKDVKRLMESIGFRNVEVQCREMLFVYDSVDALKKAVLAINPFKLPKELQQDFLEDYLEVVGDMSIMDKVNNNVGEERVVIRTHYNLIITYATK